MHRSRFAGIIIDCQTEDLSAAADFWSAALGYSKNTAGTDDVYVPLDEPEGEPYVEVQSVNHESRVHLDIETDNIEAEVARLEALGARRISAIKKWVVMEAPTGQRFCVVPVQNSRFEETANQWESSGT